MLRLQRHQHLLIGHATVASLGKARQRQARLTGLERPAPGIRACGLADHAPFEFLVAGILQAVDENNHLAGRGVYQTNIRRIEPAAGKRAHRHRLVPPERHDVERFLALACILGRAVPDADIIFAGEKLFVLRRKADHRAALRADEIVTGNADGPAEPRSHADNLVGGMHRRGTTDFRDLGHLLDAGEHLDADHGRLQAKQAVQVGHHAGQIERFRQRLLLHGVNSQIGALNKRLARL